MKKKIFLIILVIVCLFTITGCDNYLKTKDGKRLKVTKVEKEKIEYESFNNGNLKIEIPKGWKVIVPTKVTYSGYSFKVQNPENKDYTFMFSLGLSGFLKSEAARKKWASLYPASVYGKLAAMEPRTTERFFNVWNTNAKVGNQMINQEFFEYLTNFEMIENLGKTELGGDIIRGKFVNDKNEPMQGLFTASIYDAGSYYMFGLDLAPLNSYHNIMMYAPDAEFNNWQAVYDHCLSTIEFTDAFMAGFNREQQTTVATVQANAKIYDEISDMIMDSWNKRNNSYDIISQKRSDATLGYERVYNTDTGEVYRTYNGFTDEYDGTKFKPATDDMYTKTISGYIEK